MQLSITNSEYALYFICIPTNLSFFMHLVFVWDLENSWKHCHHHFPSEGFLKLSITNVFVGLYYCVTTQKLDTNILCSFISVLPKLKFTCKEWLFPLQWQHSHLMKLQPMTMFMGIGLMDRFLTQGYMKGPRNLQLLGIARTTLATHIEENHPYNWRTGTTVGVSDYEPMWWPNSKWRNLQVEWDEHGCGDLKELAYGILKPQKTLWFSLLNWIRSGYGGYPVMEFLGYKLIL